MIVAACKQANAVLAASREHRVGDSDFAMREHDNRNVLERNECGLALLDCEREVLSLQLRRFADDNATPAHDDTPARRTGDRECQSARCGLSWLDLFFRESDETAPVFCQHAVDRGVGE